MRTIGGGRKGGEEEGVSAARIENQGRNCIKDEGRRDVMPRKEGKEAGAAL